MRFLVIATIYIFIKNGNKNIVTALKYIDKKQED